MLAGSVDQQSELEVFCVNLLNTLYDDPVAFSLRDGDGAIGQSLEHHLPLRRYRLNCYAIENALLTDQCLAVMGTNWEGFIAAATKWMEANRAHRDIDVLLKLIGSEDRMRHQKIKSLRQLVCAIVECKKPWEVVVGQAIGALTNEGVGRSSMLMEFLGREMVSSVVFRDLAPVAA